jgi:hypothetical protein
MSRPRSGHHKYGAVATTVDGIRFASKKESLRYLELKLLEKAGEIKGLVLQMPYDLHAFGATSPRDKLLGRYIADFSYVNTRTGRHVVEDVKGFRTPLYRWKKKHVEAQYGIEIVEI